MSRLPTTTAASHEWTDEVLEPARNDWRALLNLSSPIADSPRLGQLRASARRRLVEAAQQFTLRLTAIGLDAGIPASTAPLLTGNADEQKIVMTGHQPTVFHGGLTYKYGVTERLADDESAIGIAIVIDTNVDVEGVGKFPVPSFADRQHHLILSYRTIAPSNRRNTVLATPLTDTDRMQQGLLPIWNPVSDRYQQVQDQYSELSLVGVRPADANLIVRWSHGIGARLLELPLSAVSGFPEVLTLIADIINEADRFCLLYNERLSEYRRAHSIRNNANPFPDLTIDGSRFELPFWVTGTDETPVPLFVETDGATISLIAGGKTQHDFADAITVDDLESLLVNHVQLIPRGALITSLLRLLFADLFVHGIGGSRYDNFTDDFIRNWWTTEPTPFVVASASQYLFAEQREELGRLEALQSDLRDLMFNPHRHFGEDRYSPELEEQLRELSDRKTQAVEQLKIAKQEGRSAKDIGHEIQTISDTMKQLVAEEFAPQLEPLTSMPADHKAAINCRTYPWFLFDSPSRSD